MTKYRQRVSKEFCDALTELTKDLEKNLGIRVSKAEATKYAAATLKGCRMIEVERNRKRSRFKLL